MSYRIEITSFFEKQLKRLIKKYPSLKSEFITLVETLKENPSLGTPIGSECYKIRLSITSKGKGKSGGARVITYVQIVETKIYLLTIYDKSEQANIKDKDITDWLNKLS